MANPLLMSGAISAFLAVALGAFGAHALKDQLTPEHLAVWQTAVNYQMWHSLGLLIIALFRQFNPGSKLLAWAGWLMSVGIFIFSGSLYLLALLDEKQLGMATPAGGLCLLLAWLLLAWSAAKTTAVPTAHKKKGRYH